MPDMLYRGMPEQEFCMVAKESVVRYWNSSKELVRFFGEIGLNDVFIVWMCKIIQNNKAMLGVSRDGDGMYFEFTRNGDDHEFYLDVYAKERNLKLSD